MIRRAGILTLALVLLASPASADDADAETRFHDAYVLEVIDGAIGNAAKAYLALLADEDVPTRIREESRFRFAICTVLLGRPDEGRMQLAAIVENERTPANLRSRAKAYLESISALGVGTELERKLQSLVFDLGRSNPDAPAVPAYRDVEIIGAPAIPFLERLLQHDDANLRRHAFRLLIRLGAEDLVARWHPGIPLSGRVCCAEVEQYLSARPEELEKLEAKLLALDDEALEQALSHFAPWPTWSFDFVRALAGRSDGLRRDAFTYLDQAGDEAARWAFARGCILGEDTTLRSYACRWAVSQDDGPPDALADELFLPAVRHLAGMWFHWQPSDNRGGASFVAWAARLSTDRLVEALTELVTFGEQPEDPQTPNPLANRQLAGLVAYALRERDLSPEQLDTYEVLVRRWTTSIAPTLEGEMGPYGVNPVAKPLRDVVERLPADRAARLVGWTFAEPAHERAEWFEDVVRVERPADASLLVEAVRRVHPDQRDVLLRRLPKFSVRWPGDDVACAELEVLSELVRLTSVEAVDAQRPGRHGLWGTVHILTDRVSDAVLARSVQAVFESALATDVDGPEGPLDPASVLFNRLVSFSGQSASQIRQRGAFHARAVLPALDAVYDRLSPALRRRAMEKVLLPLRHRYGLAPQDKSALAAYVLRHLDELAPNEWHLLASRLDLFPLAKWLPAAPAEVLNRSTMMRFEFTGGGIDEAMKGLMADPATLSDPVLAVLVAWASPEVSRPVIEGMLASKEPTLRHRALAALRPRTGYPASPEGLEGGLAAMLADVDSDPRDLAQLALLLSTVRPSERLIPAAERMLGSDDAGVQVQGILLAKRLGREELVPDLARLLTSLDASLRDKAQAAIRAIQELKRLQQEAGGG